MSANVKHCPIHGGYFGWTCPSCNGATQPPVSQQPLPLIDPTPTLMVIARTLERIADALESAVASPSASEETT